MKNNTILETRNIKIDCLKGIAITLVVVGHCIQYGSIFQRNNDFLKEPLFLFIYSFHMPLFMLISGYLFRNTICRHSWNDIVKSRFGKLLLPIFVWTSLFYFINDIYFIYKGYDIPIFEQVYS